MQEYLVPIRALVIGLLLIFFKKKVSQLIPKTFEKFPKYEEGAKVLKVKFEVNPNYIAVLGVVYIFIALRTFFAIWK
ncbi:MAG: hypothetical protein SD837_09745 [Candidatus Electrothrix scaldis]|nr:MAG: hypothetical protein SD837_09745 [Candidatus Electrothrix sp. GW3-3]